MSSERTRRMKTLKSRTTFEHDGTYRTYSKRSQPLNSLVFPLLKTYNCMPGPKTRRALRPFYDLQCSSSFAIGAISPHRSQRGGHMEGYRRCELRDGNVGLQLDSKPLCCPQQQQHDSSSRDLGWGDFRILARFGFRSILGGGKSSANGSLR